METNPVFFIGQGRSGTTAIFEAFSKHDQMAFISNYINKFYLPHIGLLHRIQNKNKRKAIQNEPKLNKFYLRPSEAYDIWEKLCGDKIRNTFMRDTHPTQAEIKNVKTYLNKIMRYQGKNKFSAKFTGPPRITYLTEIFNNAQFINIIRDPRAVVASLLNKDFWIEKGNVPFWEDTFTEEKYQIWESYGRSPVALASLEWCAIYEQTQIERTRCNNKIYDLKYESFMNDPIAEMKKLLNFLELSNNETMFTFMKRKKYNNRNVKYKERLGAEQIQIVESICKEYMEEQGYLSLQASTRG